MAVVRDRPYLQFNFLVDLGTGSTEGPNAGFQEVSAIESSVDVIEYRNGNSKENGVRKFAGLNRSADVTLRRGVIGALDLYQWFDDVRNGSANAQRNVTIRLQNEDRSDIVMTWKLLRAFPVRYSGPPLDGKGRCVAIEEIVLAYERLEVE